MNPSKSIDLGLPRAEPSKREVVVVLCAHNDDVIIGMGGTYAKYAQEGKDLYMIVFSYGEMSLPHIKREVAVATRVKESVRASRILGGRTPVYLGLKEGRFEDATMDSRLAARIARLLLQKRPSKIFTHAPDDPHPDHRAVYRFVMSLLDRINLATDVYCFDVWNPMQFRRRNEPLLVVDISRTFTMKQKAMDMHESQRVVKYVLWWNLYLKSIINGLAYGYRHAEVFRKVR